MIETSVSRRVTLESYDFEVLADQATFFVSTEPNGNNTWNGMATPGLVAFDPAENGPALVVSLRSIYFNGSLQVDGLTVTLNAPGIRIVDPVNTYNGALADWLPFSSGAGSLDVDWGDSSPIDRFELSAGGLDPLPEHVYAEAGTYAVVAVASFDDVLRGGAPSVVLDVEVVAP